MPCMARGIIMFGPAECLDLIALGASIAFIPGVVNPGSPLFKKSVTRNSLFFKPADNRKRTTPSED